MTLEWLQLPVEVFDRARVIRKQPSVGFYFWFKQALLHFVSLISVEILDVLASLVEIIVTDSLQNASWTHFYNSFGRPFTPSRLIYKAPIWRLIQYAICVACQAVLSSSMSWFLGLFISSYCRPKALLPESTLPFPWVAIMISQPWTNIKFCHNFVSRL